MDYALEVTLEKLEVNQEAAKSLGGSKDERTDCNF